MALDDIFRALDEQADEECEQILKEAEEHAVIIAADAEDQAETIRQAHVAETERITRSKASQSVNAAKLEARKRVAGVKQKAVQRAFERSEAMLDKVREDGRYDGVFRRLTEEALTGVEGHAVVQVDPADEARARAAVEALGADAEVRAELSTAGGLVVLVDNGRIIRRNTLEDRLSKVRELYQAKVAERLIS